MPFTFAHAAIALPFANRKVNRDIVTGLLVGSLTPDFEYFFRLSMVGGIGHTILGLFVFCLPTGLVLGILWHSLWKVPLIDNLPSQLFARVSDLRFRSPRTMTAWILYSGAVIIGAITHLVWDSFTHRTRFFVQQVPWLSNPWLLEIPVYKYLQHLSTLIGLAAIMIFIVRLPRVSTSRPACKNRFFWPALAIGLVLGWATIQWVDPLPFSANNVGYHAVRIISGSMASLSIICVIFRRHCS